MLLQGIILAGVTVLITIQRDPQVLVQQQTSVHDVMEWTRRCSLVLAIMSERWQEKSIASLEVHFSALAKYTFKRVIPSLTGSNPTATLNEVTNSNFPQDIQPEVAATEALPQTNNDNNNNTFLTNSQNISQTPWTEGNQNQNQNDTNPIPITFQDFPLEAENSSPVDPFSSEPQFDLPPSLYGGGFMGFGDEEMLTFWDSVLPQNNASLFDGEGGGEGGFGDHASYDVRDL